MNKNILFTFGQRVRKLRRERCLSQEELADKCGLHRTYISDVELGKRNVSLENIARIAESLEISLPDLFLEV